LALVELVESQTLGAAWLEVARRIVETGDAASWGGAATRELTHLTVVVSEPDPDDPTIAALGDAEWLAWMHANFFDFAAVRELGNADSYATRIFDYEHSGKDQLAWVVGRLREDAECRDATITTFQPHTDTTYIPCVSLLDFWRRNGAIELVVYAHGLDFGKKAYGNLVELAALQGRVADELGLGSGPLVLHVKTAHVYEPELELMRSLVTPTMRRV
jgi:thymidylate synthase